MTINQNLTTINFTAAASTGRIKYIVMHYTANDGDTAWGNTNYFKSVYRGASAHYFVDENSIWQCVLDKDIAWHCGTSGAYVHPLCRNTNSLGIEICSRRDSKGEYYFKEETITNAVWLTKMLMDRYGVPAANVIRHYDVTGKICPAPYVDSPAAWGGFKARLTQDTAEPEKPEEEDMTEAEVKAIADASAKAAIDKYIRDNEIKPASDWAAITWKEAEEAGIFDGNNPRSPLTREQAAMVFSKTGLLGLSSNPVPSDWAREAWDILVDEGIFDGTNPREALTREQFAVVMQKILTNKNKDSKAEN